MYYKDIYEVAIFFVFSHPWIFLPLAKFGLARQRSVALPMPSHAETFLFTSILEKKTRRDS